MKNKYFEIREACPACESKSNKELYRAKYIEPPISTYLNDFYNPQGGVEFNYLEGEIFILNECTECGLVYQKDIPNDFLMIKLYEEWINPEIILSNRIKQHGINSLSKLAREIEMVINHFNLPTSELKFLDFGSGWGDWCNLAKGYGCKALGTELSQSRIDYSSKLGVPIIKWEEISKHQFDFINTEQVFEHIPKPLETLRYLVQSLKPNGVIKISVPNGGEIKKLLSIMDWNAQKYTKNSLNTVAPLEHINCFSQYSIMKMAQKIKLTAVELKIKKAPKLIDYTIRDILRPIYHTIKFKKIIKDHGSTYLFFSRVSTTD